MRFAIRNWASVFLTSLAAGISSADAAPAAVDGWRYVEGPNQLHVYVCERSDCAVGSRVFFRFNTLSSAVFPGILRKQEAAASDILGEPSKVFSPFAIDLSTGQMHGVAKLMDGSKAYYSFGDVDGSNWRASLSSSSRDETASQVNLEKFEAVLKSVRN
ncbi:hypothetical protein [Bradyrhizobium erythrophlei]|jgi:hypothetical protein|uniref:hypothetical protein n=1 Tax=Bradyrhizobium erythrophlei TaxID=1437360 RepID=UPI0012EB8DA7|nr:hypothetical protein [Bradyrhizobium erythrophlei]